MEKGVPWAGQIDIACFAPEANLDVINTMRRKPESTSGR